METFTFVFESLRFARIFAPHLRKTFKGQRLFVIFSPRFFGSSGVILPRYPRGLARKEYPRVDEPRFTLVSSEALAPHFKPQSIDAHGALCSVASTLCIQSIAQATDRFFCFNGFDSSGASAFDVLLSVIASDLRSIERQAAVFLSIGQAGIAQALSSIHSYEGGPVHELAKSGRVKHYVDWNWNMNGNVVFGEALCAAGCSNDAPPISKFSLQLLYAINAAGPIAYGSTLMLMQRWQGTGRYPAQAQMSGVALGSSASRALIIDALAGAGLISVEGHSLLISITDRGRRFLRFLHKDCEDFDLPFRIRDWSSRHETCYPKINRYLKTFFGKQLRFFNKNN